jgi:hypothetical protein
MGIFKNDPVCRLRNEKEVTACHIVFDCEALTRWRYISVGYSGAKKKTSKEKPDKMVANLAKGQAEP